MCHTTISGTDDDDNMDEISSTSLASNNKKTGKHIEPRKVRKSIVFYYYFLYQAGRGDVQCGDDLRFKISRATLYITIGYIMIHNIWTFFYSYSVPYI